MPDYSNLLFELKDNVAHITLNRPDAFNAMNRELCQELMHATLRCDEDPTVRAVVISGAGRTFSGGGDLKTFAAQGDKLPTYVKEVTTYLHAAISRLIRMDAPVIAAVHGSAAGGGFSLACACDIVIAAQSAKFTMAYTRAGLTPDGSSTYFLPRVVGFRKAMELALTNAVLTAEEGMVWGLVTRVVPDANLMNEAYKIATDLAAGSKPALGATKRLLHSGFVETLETQMELESRAIADAARGADSREGIAAFIEKRTPNFNRK
jgi:2-(1,2-epoxy-1,2-dihydrophenyl)acetyl-CoA isomerase